MIPLENDMKKSERLNKMLLFLNDKSEFNLKELMEKFHISKSTALRDIAALEEIGLPLYSSLGKHGRYHIMNHRMRYSINFSHDEIYALYFALLTLQNYQSTPFHLDVDHLKQKFQLSVSSESKEKLIQMSQFLEFESTAHFNESPLLKEILMYAVANQPVCLTYEKDDQKLCIDAQIMSIHSRFGQWYVTVFDLAKQSSRVCRCDRITAIHSIKHDEPLPMEEIHRYLEFETTYEKNTKFIVEIHKKGVDLFHKESYPSMKLRCDNNKTYIEGYYQPNEIDFIVKYFVNFGGLINSISPKELQQKIVNYLDGLKEQISSLK